MTKSSALRPAWTPLTIGLMILGFVIWWPLGLAMIAYIVWGDQYQNEINSAVRKIQSMARDIRWGDHNPFSRPDRNRPTGNTAFNAYRLEQIEQLEEERKRLDDEVREFEDFLAKLRDARDKEEFDRFMRNRHNRRGAGNRETIEI